MKCRNMTKWCVQLAGLSVAVLLHKANGVSGRRLLSGDGPNTANRTRISSSSSSSPRRRLSDLDYQLHWGSLPPYKEPSRFYNASLTTYWRLIHIPKTAGDSAMADAPIHLPVGSKLKGNEEKAYLQTQGRPSSMVVFIREPISHVLSQFLECKYDVWGRRVTENTKFPGRLNSTSILSNDETDVMHGFDEWIHHFVYDQPIHSYNYANDKEFSYRCYNPWNMQARYMATETKMGHPHLVHQEADRVPSLEIAKDRLRSIKVVGITSYYTASMCLLEYHALGGRLSPKCRICDTETQQLNAKAKQNHKSHGVPKHSVNMISDETKQLIQQNLTTVDQLVYEHALELFHEQVEQVRGTLGVDLLCRNGDNHQDVNETETQNLQKTRTEASNNGEETKRTPVVVPMGHVNETEAMMEADNYGTETTLTLVVVTAWFAIGYIAFLWRDRKRAGILRR